MTIKSYNSLFRNVLVSASLAVALGLTTTGCEDTKSYAELLSDENKVVNRFLVDQNVIPEVPADSVFLTGEDAPYYCIDSEKAVYMKVLDPGDGERATEGQKVYFRFLYFPLASYNGTFDSGDWTGNADNITSSPTSFKFNDYTDTGSQEWGTGIQMPLNYLGLNCHVRLVVKSQYGMTANIASVVPLLFDIRYFKSQI